MDLYLSHGIAAIKWIKSCNKYDMTACDITILQNLYHDIICHNNAIRHLNYINFEGNEISFKRSYDKQLLTIMAISYEIFKLAERCLINFI